MDAPPNQKSSKSRRDTAVQGTNDSSIVSKCSMAKFGYFSDNFLHKFVSKQSRRAPLIHRAYFIRAKAIDFILREFLKRAGPKQIISLGAGFDSTYFRLKSEGLLDDTVFIELDFPQVVTRKASIIIHTEDLRCFIEPEQIVNDKSDIVINGNDYKLLGVDITNTSKVEELLKKCEIKGDKPTLFLSECVMTYIKDDSVSRIIHWTRGSFQNATFVLYEQINPSDAFGKVMINHFTKIGSPLRCIQSYPTLHSQLDRFTRAGWINCEALDMNQFYNNLLSTEERQRIDNLEPFDEYEEWHLKCSHYIVLCAYTFPGHQILNSCITSHHSKTNPITDCLGDKSTSLGSSNDGALVCLDDGGMATSLTDPMNQCSLSKDGLPWISPDPKAEETVGEKPGSHSPNTILIENDQTAQDSKDVHRFSHSSVKIKDQILVIGGFGYHGTRHCRLGDACLLNLGLQCSSTIICSHSELIDRMHHAMVTSESYEEVFIFGGRHSPLSPEKRIVCLKIKKASELCNLGDDRRCTVDIHVIGEMSPARWRHTALLHQGKEAVYIFGGKSVGSPVLSDCQVYHLSTNTWDNVSFPGVVCKPRHSHSAVMWNSCMVITGGLGPQLLPLDDIVLFHLEERKCSGVKLIGNLKRRYSHTSHVLDDILVLVGGVNLDHTPPGLAAVHLPTGLCQEYSLPVSERDRGVIMYHNHTSVLTEDNRLIIIGGGGNCFSFGTHFNNTPLVLNITTCLQDFETRVKEHVS